jgi:microcystin-dependent protein
MFEGFLGEIRMFTTDSVPEGWLPCDGRTVEIRDNPALYSLYGTYYGGNGQTTFALPDLRARVPIHVSEDHQVGDRVAATTEGGRAEEQAFLALNFCICAAGVFPHRA